MARSQRRSAPSRSASSSHSSSSRTAPPPQQQHHQVPAAAPVSAPPAPMAAAAPQQPSLFANMASTAAGVAVGSAVGHTLGAGLSSMFGGGGSSHAPAVEQAAPQTTMPQSSTMNGVGACDTDQKAFLRCLDANANDITACQFYLDMLKQCQASNRPY